jgi:hypothetical protein
VGCLRATENNVLTGDWKRSLVGVSSSAKAGSNIRILTSRQKSYGIDPNGETWLLYCGQCRIRDGVFEIAVDLGAQRSSWTWYTSWDIRINTFVIPSLRCVGENVPREFTH